MRSLDANGVEIFDMAMVVDVEGEKITLGNGRVFYGIFSEETQEMVLHDNPTDLHRWRGEIAARKPQTGTDYEMRGDSVRFGKQAPSGAFSQRWRS